MAPLQNTKLQSSARLCALDALNRCLTKRQPLDTAWAGSEFSRLTPPDRAFAQLLAKTTLRRLGQIDALIEQLIERPLPDSAAKIKHILRLGITQLIWLETPPHAAVNESVEMVKAIKKTSFTGLVNAVLKRVDKEGQALVQMQDEEKINTPDWLWQSWCDAYGEETCRAIARAHLGEPPLDITVNENNHSPRLRGESEGGNFPHRSAKGFAKQNPSLTASPASGGGIKEYWAQKLNAHVLPTGTLRLKEKGNITKLAGFDEGAWWVQDAAASIPALLLGKVQGEHIIDLCAAPGGKTAQLAVKGAKVTAVEVSASRMRTLKENMQRLKLEAEFVTADALKWTPNFKADGILLDAPCSATGTLRRHPDVALNRTPEDISRLTATQYKLLNHALDMLKPGGKLVYAVCSLQPEEGKNQIAKLLEARSDAALLPAPPYYSAYATPQGALRTLPCHMAESGGMDGFYAALLTKT